ncbi:DNA polymerase III subunit gamma/tau [Helicobacter cynogastricus]|uniref:DNA polymerase III subunit gamma/tau n=1 Tax=Helicobacter cynogastricus TaxID=329937 RepID=UPI000CF19C01|nr:DNA polymerase III subunit gamma/tau [Helicobacter cynogastricus]
MVLALKYRPKHFKDLAGQESVSKTLSLALERGCLAHAYLFSGLRGSGKTSSARIFARALQCEKAPTSTPCDVCANCVDALQNKHLDIIEMDGASNRRIEDIRDVIEQTKYQPSMGAFKVFIIDEVHMLTKEAFNALLKTLEEPPAHVKFILATTDPLKLPATILSRTQHFHFKKIPSKVIVAHLQHILNLEGVEYQEGVLEILARSGGGSLRDTLTLTEQAISYSAGSLTLERITQMLGLVDAQVLHDFFQTLRDNPERVCDSLALFEEYDPQIVLDEMSLFLKEALLHKTFPIALVDAWMGVLAQAKALLHAGADGDFVLTLSVLKMQATLAPQAPSASQRPTPVAIQTPAPTPTSRKQLTPQELFEKLITRIHAHNPNLGDLFKKFVQFHAFENKTLWWVSSADTSSKEILMQNFELIKQLVVEVFGEGVQVQALKITPPSPSASSSTPPPVIPNLREQFMQENSNLVGAMQEHLGIIDVKVEKS